MSLVARLLHRPDAEFVRLNMAFTLFTLFALLTFYMLVRQLQNRVRGRWIRSEGGVG